MSPFWAGVVAGFLVGVLLGVGAFIGLLEILGSGEGERHP